MSQPTMTASTAVPVETITLFTRFCSSARFWKKPMKLSSVGSTGKSGRSSANTSSFFMKAVAVSQ